MAIKYSCTESLHTAQSNLLNQKSKYILLKMALLPATMDTLWIWLKVLGIYKANNTDCNWLLKGALGPVCQVLMLLLFTCSFVSDSLWPHGLQHARPPCPSPAPGVHSDSRPSSQWCHLTSYPLSSPSPPALNLSQHQGLFQWVDSLH